MSVKIALAFDLGCLIVLLSFAVRGWKSGLAGTLAVTVGYIVSFVASNMIAQSFAPAIYDNAVKNQAVEIIEERLAAFDSAKVFNLALDQMGIDFELSEEDAAKISQSKGDVADGLAELAKASGMPNSAAENIRGQFYLNLNEEKIAHTLSEQMNEHTAEIVAAAICDGVGNMSNAIKAVGNPDSRVGAEYIETTIVRPIVVSIVRTILIMVLFVVLSFLMKNILRGMKLFNKIRPAAAVNKIGGAAVGFAQGALTLAIVGFVCSFLMKITGGIGAMRADTLDNTVLFRLFFSGFYNN